MPTRNIAANRKRPEAVFLALRNRQSARQVRLRALRQITRHLLDDLLALKTYEICVHLVAVREITRLNETFLQHAGDTDVITFTHARPPQAPALVGEIFICVEVAVRQAKTFRTTWPGELARYVVHGVLHLLGYEDGTPVARREMKRIENRLLRRLSRKFSLAAMQR
jgi:rRNA maturation RNase YbeY